MKLNIIVFILLFPILLLSSEAGYYNSLIENKNKLSFTEFKKLTDFDEKTINQCLIESSKRHKVPLEVLNSIIDVENSRKLPFAINCNNNIKPYSTSIYDNYYNYLNCNDNMDMGVMQVNFYIWKQEYPNLKKEHILNSCINIELSSRILKMHYDDTSDWVVAAGRYHSKTPKHFNNYIRKIIKSLKKQNVLIGDYNELLSNYKIKTKTQTKNPKVVFLY